MVSEQGRRLQQALVALSYCVKAPGSSLTD